MIRPASVWENLLPGNLQRLGPGRSANPAEVFWNEGSGAFPPIEDTRGGKHWTNEQATQCEAQLVPGEAIDWASGDRLSVWSVFALKKNGRKHEHERKLIKNIRDKSNEHVFRMNMLFFVSD